MTAVAKKIESKITGFRLADNTTEAPKAAEVVTPEVVAPAAPKILDRPEEIHGSTYKVKPPVSDHALYITINDVVDEDGKRRPFEVFLNSKDMQHFQWIAALTRVISAVFRHASDSSFIIEELEAVFDPNGGYYKKGGVYMPSLVAEIGATIKRHMQSIGYIDAPGSDLSDDQKAMLAEKRSAYEASLSKDTPTEEKGTGYPANATRCNSCSEQAVIIMDGCQTCLSCGNSKCN